MQQLVDDGVHLFDGIEALGHADHQGAVVTHPVVPLDGFLRDELQEVCPAQHTEVGRAVHTTISRRRQRKPITKYSGGRW
jgi:hypothetical protein